MIGLFQKCARCRKRGFIIKKRSYDFSPLPVGKITSEDKLCLICKLTVVEMITKKTPTILYLWRKCFKRSKKTRK